MKKLILKATLSLSNLIGLKVWTQHSTQEDSQISSQGLKTDFGLASYKTVVKRLDRQNSHNRFFQNYQMIR